MMGRWILIFLLNISFSLFSQTAHIVQNGPIHEAFMHPTGGSILLQGIEVPPPKPITETIPRSTSSDAHWIAGYWDWSDDWNDFIWISGVWRKPPPGHHWVPSFWKQFDEGWVRLKGFWSSRPYEQLDFYEVPPPDPIDENVGFPPNSNYFWASGYWKWINRQNNYAWVKGKWEMMDPNWVLVPAHYIWRPEGYLLIPSYWDWPLDRMGQAYSCVYIEPEYRDGFVYLPTSPIDVPLIFQRIFIYYPNYLCWCWHHWHFHHGWWDEFCCEPVWWEWSPWWCFTWHDQWAIWWWWCHPGYPQPPWFPLAVSAKLPPPGNVLLNMIKDIQIPDIITPNGVVGPNALIDAIADVLENDNPLPILPADKKKLDEVIKIAGETLPKIENIYKPSGKPGEVIPIQPKPNVDTTTPSEVFPPEVPLKPRLPEVTRPPIQVIPPPPPRRPDWQERPTWPQEPPRRRRPRRPRPPRERPTWPRPRWPQPETEPQSPERPTWPRPQQPQRPRWPQPELQPRVPDYQPQRPERPQQPQRPRWPQPELQPRVPDYQPQRPERPQQPPRLRWPQPELQPQVPDYKPREPKYPQDQEIQRQDKVYRLN